jgi:hypothetical protein
MMERILFEKEVWAEKGKNYSPELLKLLTSRDCLIVLSHGKTPYKVVLGIPHQAAIGMPVICEKLNNGRGRPSDENAASYALVAFSILKEHDISCKIVIAAHPTTLDPNKDPKTEYCQEILKDPAELLLECHGARNQRKLDLELSAGQNALSPTKTFGEFLASALKKRYALGVQKEKGTDKARIFDKDGKITEGFLENPATETTSLKEAQMKGIAALHIEAKPQFRRPEGGADIVTPDGLILGKALAQAVIRYRRRLRIS